MLKRYKISILALSKIYIQKAIGKQNLGLCEKWFSCWF